jgi:hypothetical protein
MVYHRVLFLTASALCAASMTGAIPAIAASVRPASSAGVWGTAREVPGVATLNKAGEADISSVSCPSPGNCGAGGSYGSVVTKGGITRIQSFVVDESHGVWGKAEEVPGSAALNKTGMSEVNSVSCGSAGNCSAGGYYSDSIGDMQAFVVNERNGVWGQAEEVPGSGALNRHGFAEIQTVSCASAGNCSAGGFYLGGVGTETFVVSERKGTWGKAEEVPGYQALAGTRGGQMTSMSCSSAGNCSAVGSYTTGTYYNQLPFLVSEKDGIWGKATQVPGLSAIGQRAGAPTALNAVSCSSAGNCSAVGAYSNTSTTSEAFVVSQRGGTWGNAENVPGTGALSTNKYSQLLAVSCASAGNCSAVGNYQGRARYEAFAVSQTSGVWGMAREIPGIASLNTGGNATLFTISCSSGGDCGAGGYYTTAQSLHKALTEPLVATQINGRWLRAEELPGAAALNTDKQGGVTWVSCPSPHRCTAVGDYVTAASKDHEVFAAG